MSVSALQVLRFHFHASLTHFGSELQEKPERRQDVLDFLKNFGLIAAFNGQEYPIPTKYGLTVEGASNVPAFKGLKDNLSVDQHYYSAHRINLEYPTMPCIEIIYDNDYQWHNIYYPLELVRLTEGYEMSEKAMKIFKEVLKHDRQNLVKDNPPFVGRHCHFCHPGLQ